MSKSAVLLALVYLGVFSDVTEAGATIPLEDIPKPSADLFCITDTKTGIVSATLLLRKEDSPVNRAFFAYQDNDAWYEFEDAGCNWTGTGTELDPFTATVTLRLDDNQTPFGAAYCGHTVYNEEEKVYEWKVYAEREHDISMRGDNLISYRCSGLDLPNHISTTIDEYIPPVEEIDPHKGAPQFGFYGSSESIVQDLDLNLGDDFRLALWYSPDNPTGNDEAAMWGAYCRELYVTPTPSRTYRRFDLLDNNGCPRTHPFLKLNEEFVGTYPITGGTFKSRTGLIQAALFDKSSVYPTENSNTLYFVCEAELCFKPRDPMCINRCEANTKRRKRSVSTPQFTVFVNVTINVPSDASSDENFIIPVLASIVGFILLLLVVVAAVFACCRRTGRYRHHVDSNSSSTTSEPPPYYSSGKHSISDKMSHAYSKHSSRY